MAEHLCAIEITVLSLDSTSTKVHPNGAGAPKKKRQQSIGKSKGGWNTKIRLVAANEQTAIKFHLSGGDKHDSPEGRKMVTSLSDEFC
ncbi:hypothetical protein FACS189454_08380 [Planctomycetales bacterium]|nr:hypothetical protein FACS189454_08380 [Planctomycetales bacterium]